MRIIHIPLYLFCFALSFMSCRPEGTVVRVDKDSFTVADQVKIGQTLTSHINQNPFQYPLYDRSSNQEMYEYLDTLFWTIVNTSEVENRNIFPWKVYVLKDTIAMTAFSMPGGTIYITDGFLKFITSEAQLFAVLSSEVCNSDQGSVMSLLQNNYSGLTLGDIVFNNPVDELDEMITTLHSDPLSADNTKISDKFSVATICPFSYAPDALATVIELELSDSEFPLEWSLIRPTYEGRTEMIRSYGIDCGSESNLWEERYKQRLLRHLDL